ncbi:Lrp/AsnC family transcriptional regulator [Alterinioella nitratireducens]|uniref:Lrp/AsnC family transcriptional regulator n=1 Tax=Alterinioella nitratireducens TaxID=2735915 RepID=UPI000C4ED54E|nr:AsnC family transcriptional regulator [Nioella sp.]
MDDIDTQLIAALRRDGRAALSDLATTLGITRATVRARIEKLTQAGEIQGFTVLTRADLAQSPVRALTMLGIEGPGMDRIRRQLSGMAEVEAVHATNGKWDLIVQLGTPTLEALDDALRRIRRLDGVATSETSLLLSTSRYSRL